MSEHLPRLEIAGGLSCPRQHHAAADIGHHRGELNEGVIAHLLEITVPHQGGFDPWHGVAEFGERDRLTVIQLLSIRSRHRDGCRLIEALIQQKCQQCGQHTGVVLVEGVAEPREHRGHVLGGFDVLPFNVVDTSRHLDVWGKLVHQLGPQHGREGIGMAEVGRETVEGIPQRTVPMEA